eukprot:TRINITY_DN93869_c0_g1_i1.p1 TRINITY_DN93869_c0_g1~~TRINITY_DN93869_c0_g1_i1.p1  ORF type:complete len:592 (+),score=104.64 TRINITY_DN93869_c0_g1_i1:61-1776(+)
MAPLLLLLCLAGAGAQETTFPSFSPSITGVAVAASTTSLSTAAETEGLEETEDPKTEEEAEEEAFTPEGIGVSYTLLGSLAFAMTILYLVNWSDDDVRRYSWLVISMTISIFCAVLVYTGLSRWLGKMILGSSEPNSGLECLFFYSLFVLWFVGLELTVGYSAGLLCIGALHDEDLDKEQWVVEENMRCSHQEQMLETSIVFARWGRGVAMGPDGYPVFLRQRNLIMEHVDRRMKCWGTIMAHAAGFAAIHAGAMLQHTGWFETSWFGNLVAALIHQFALFLAFRLLEAVPCSNKPEKLVDLYYDQLDDGENDVTALSFSFLLVQTLKYILSGVPSNAEGLQPEDTIPSGFAGAGVLAICGLLFLALSMVMIRSWREQPNEPPLVSRAREILPTTCSMLFSWCTIASVRWGGVNLSKAGTLPMKPSSMGMYLFYAGCMSAFAFLLTVILDKIEDSTKVDSIGGGYTRMTDLLFKNAITSLGLIVGLSWETVFDKAVEVSSSRSSNPITLELIESLAVVAFIVPAWRRYILSKQIYYEEMKSEFESRSFMKKDLNALRADELLKSSRQCWLG